MNLARFAFECSHLLWGKGERNRLSARVCSFLTGLYPYFGKMTCAESVYGELTFSDVLAFFGVSDSSITFELTLLTMGEAGAKSTFCSFVLVSDRITPILRQDDMC